MVATRQICSEEHLCSQEPPFQWAISQEDRYLIDLRLLFRYGPNIYLNVPKEYYDQLVDETNCTSSDNTLACLRAVPLDTLKTAVDNTPNYFSYDVSCHLYSSQAIV